MEDKTAYKGRKCRPCEGTEIPWPLAQSKEALKKMPAWHISEDGKTIFREYVMKNFVAAVDLIDLIAEVAEYEGHHPDIHLTGYRKLRVELSTHAIGGLSGNDFIMAARINELPVQLKV